jgi:hypothetical protein
MERKSSFLALRIEAASFFGFLAKKNIAKSLLKRPNLFTLKRIVL